MPTDRMPRVGDYPAARDLDDAEREFEEAGEVQKTTQDSGPEGRAPVDEIERAEQEGRTRHVRGEGATVGDVSPTTIAQPPKGN